MQYSILLYQIVSSYWKTRMRIHCLHVLLLQINLIFTLKIQFIISFTTSSFIYIHILFIAIQWCTMPSVLIFVYLAGFGLLCIGKCILILTICRNVIMVCIKMYSNSMIYHVSSLDNYALLFLLSCNISQAVYLWGRVL